MLTRHRITTGVAVGLVVLLGFPPLGRVSAQNSRGQGSIHRDDPCDQLPNPPGKAKGIEKHCPAGGSSSGVAKGDFNGDGFADLAIGVPEEDTGGAEDAGAVNVIYGSASGVTATDSNVPAPQFWSQNSTGISGSSEAGDRFGTALASGDFNGDGFSDLAIGVPGENVSGADGRVVVIYGSRNGLSTTDSTVPASQSFDGRSISRNPYPGMNAGGGGVGSALAWGDFDNDGRGDLAIGMPLYQWSFPGGITCNCAGGIWVLQGRQGGLTLSGNRLWVEKDIPGSSNSLFLSFFGETLAAGDFNGDGHADLAIGVPFRPNENCSLPPFTSGCGVGTVYVLYGGSLGVSPSNGSDIWSQGSSGIAGAEEESDHFGASLAVGDFNGDGWSDLAIGVPGEDISGVVDTGAVEVIYGSSSGLTSSGSQFWDLNGLGGVYETGAQFGFAVAAGDFNGDGRADLAIGAPFKDVAGGAVDGGEVDVIYGSSTGLSKTSHPVQIWSQDSAGIAGGSESGDQFGASLTAWNFGKNEFSRIAPGVVITSADLAIGVPHENIGSISDAGAVHVIYGSVLSNGLTSTGSQFWSQGSTGIPGGAEAGDHFGASMY